MGIKNRVNTYFKKNQYDHTATEEKKTPIKGLSGTHQKPRSDTCHQRFFGHTK